VFVPVSVARAELGGLEAILRLLCLYLTPVPFMQSEAASKFPIPEQKGSDALRNFRRTTTGSPM
jgi:hypothetical protein